MHSQPVLHIHVPHSHLDLGRFGRDAVIAAMLGLSALVVTASERTLRSTVGSSDGAVVQQAAVPVNVPLGVEVQIGSFGVLAIVRGLDTAAVNSVFLVNDHGGPVAPLSTVFGVRFAQLPAGSYRVVVSSEGPTLHVDGAAISSAVIVRSEPFILRTPAVVVVESR